MSGKANDMKYSRAGKYRKIAFAALPFLMAGEALSDTANANVNSLNIQKIVVSTDGQTYKSSNLASHLNVGYSASFDAQNSGKVKKWKVWASLGVKGSPKNEWSQFKDHGYGESYKAFSRPNKVSKVATVTVPSHLVRQAAVFYCNAIAASLRNQGKDNQEIFSVDRTATLQVKMDYTYDMSGIPGGGSGDIPQGGGSITAPVNEIELKCLKVKIDFSPATNLSSNPSTVTDLSITLTEDASADGNRCRVNIASAFHTSKPNTEIQYRYVYRNMEENVPDKYSAYKTITTDHAKVATTADWYDVPVVDGVEKGLIWLESKSPNSLKSQWKTYEMNCTNELSVAAIHPIQRNVKFTAKTGQMYGAQECAVEGHIVVGLKATGTPFEGTARLEVKNEDGEQFSSGNFDISLSANGASFFGMPFNPEWGQPLGLTTSASGFQQQMKQTLKYRVVLSKNGNSSGQLPAEKELHLMCSFKGLGLGNQVQRQISGSQNLQAAQSAGTPAVAVARPLRALPDLTIKKAVQTGKRRMKVLVENVGKGAANNSFLRMSGGAGNQKEKRVAKLAPGKKVWVVIKLPKVADKAVFTIDSKRQVKESNEGNNLLSQPFKK